MATVDRAARTNREETFWSITTDQLFRDLGTGASGLSANEAGRRLAAQPARRDEHEHAGPLRVLLSQFRSPILLILIVAALLSYFLHDPTDAVIIVVIVAASAGLGFWQEWQASDAVAKLLERVKIRATVLRDGQPVEVAAADVLPGDVVVLSAGSTVPGDCRILESKDLYAVEAALTGETYPAEKSPGQLPADTPLARRTNTLFFGTHIASGTVRAVVVRTGADTEFGQISERLHLRPPETEFERGVRRFGYFLAEVTMLLVLGIFAVNVYFHRPFFDALLFSLALAVGLTPQLLPAVIMVNLSHGARRMADVKVIVKRLSCIENLGSMDVLCSDKTGTLTEGTIRVHSAADPAGNPSERVLFYAALNAALESGFANPIDEAIRTHREFDFAGYEKLDEVPYDFVRKRLSVLVASASKSCLVAKGALPQILAVSSMAEAGGELRALEDVRPAVEREYAALSREGLRCLGVAIRDLGPQRTAGREDETGMIFLGFVALDDPLKVDAADTISELRRLGVSLRVITGDNRLVTETMARRLGIEAPVILGGSELSQMSDEALRQRVGAVDLFAEVEPNQKERILIAFKKAGHVVGFLGDGINDASALHAADVGLSVDGAVDVAKEAADLVLLDRDLAVVAAGVREGRSTFANTLKYVFMATSANFGNMFSMAGASLFLPFLPLLPKQILLTNLMTDLPEMTIASDRVDQDWIDRPHRWNIPFIRKFMLVFGSLSSLFDFATFAVLWFVLHAPTEAFRTGWFVESVVSAALIVLVVRTRGRMLRSRPAGALTIATVCVCVAALALPFLPLAPLLGFSRLPAAFYPILGGIVLFYLASAEVAKAIFYRRAAF
jgi:P-type Mg2+ transporter